MPPTPLLDARGVTKSFGGAKALDGALLSLASGEVHALLGANGAGKSTLSRVISGHIRRDAGTITLGGAPLDLRSPREALDAGVALVMQETSLAPDLTVLENIFLPHLARPGRLSRAAMRARADAILDELGQQDALGLDQEVRALSAAQRQLVEIAKTLALDAKLVIFDEPTTSLSAGEVERLFDVMARMTAAGCALGFVSHRLEEVFAVSDRITVMREGRTVAAGVETAAMSQAELIRHMVGRDLSAIYAPRAAAGKSLGVPILSVRGLATPPLVKDVTFDLHRGEILGLGGLVGAGRSETLEALFGLRPRTGEVTLEGAPFAPKSPRDAIRAGLGFVAEDRRTQSIVPDLSVRENLLLGHLAARKGPTLGYGAMDARIQALMARLELPAARLKDDNLLNFSGGMQQKILIARWLLLDPKVLILDEPTKGVDIGTRASIYQILREIAARGVAILVVSSDFEELLGLTDRVVVVSDGRSIASVPSGELDEETLTLFAAPRSSHERSRRLLEELSSEHDGAAFWGVVDGARVFCLDVVGARADADPGLSAGATPRFEETFVGEALRRRDAGFVRDCPSGLTSLIVEVKSPRGHDLGTVGLVLPAGRAAPDAVRVRASIEQRFREAV